MPLRCIDPNGLSIHSFDLSDEHWQTLVQENRKARHLRMHCCDAEVTLKKSRRGTRFFAHKAVGSCTTAPESEAHLYLKRAAVVAARKNGWIADTEVTGTTPSGTQWIADVFAQKGKHKVAVEIQWSGQMNDETLRRQERYKEADVRGLWLLRQPGFPITHDLPAVCIGGNLEEGFTALIPSFSTMNARDRSQLSRWHQVLPMHEFLDAAFSHRFQFDVPHNADLVVSIWGAEMSCYSCGADTQVVTRIEVNFGPNKCYFSLAKLGEHAKLVPIVLGKIPRNIDLGEIKYRFSKTAGEKYLSNGCAHCNALIGDYFVFPENSVANEIQKFSVKVSPEWLKVISNFMHDTWSVYSTLS